MELKKLLEEIGLTGPESRCYMALHSLKEAKSGKISKKANIATPNLYPILSSLMKKGLASYKIVNNVKIFMPAPAEVFNELIEDKQKRLDEQKDQVQEAISKLRIPMEVSDSFSNYKFFTGVAGVKSMWLEILEYMKQYPEKSILKVYSMKRPSVENLIGFYDEFHKERKKLNQGYKLILSSEFKKHAMKRKKEGAKVKFTEINGDAGFGVFEELYFVSYNVGKNPIAFLIKDRKIADSFDEIFEKLWKSI